MGMYNEVFQPCPNSHCGIGYAQIPQIVDGFGGFYLNKPETFEELSTEHLERLLAYVEDEIFICDKCGLRFGHKSCNPERDRIIQKLTVYRMF